MGGEADAERTANDVTLIEHLAHHRMYHPNFRENRRSVYWIDKFPPVAGADGYTIVTSSERTHELAKPKPVHPLYRGDKNVIWELPKTSPGYRPTTRVVALSRAKTLPADFKHDRPVITDITDAAMRGQTSNRVERLAAPKSRDENVNFFVKEVQWGESPFVSDAAMKANASNRVETLAESRHLPKAYEAPKVVPWLVSLQARNNIASTRVQQLSRPGSRSLLKDDYDPYKISYAARHNQGSARLEELSNPLARKHKKKFVIGI